MKIVIYIRSLLIGGAEKQSILLASELQKKHEVILLIHHKEENEISKKNVKNIHYLNKYKIIDLFTFIKSNKPDALICLLPINNILGSFIGKLTNVPKILCGVRGSQKKSLFKHLLMKFICNKLNIKFVANNYYSKKVYTELGFNFRNIEVIHNGINIDKLTNSIDRSIEFKSNYNLISIGRFVNEKDFVTLIKAINFLVNELNFNKIHLKIAGYGPLKEELKLNIENFKLNNYIELIDGQTFNKKTFLLEGDLFILTSIHEGMPNTIMEAMSFKIPIISTNVGDVNFLVQKDYNGYVLNVKDYREIAFSIKKILTNPTQYKYFSENSYNEILKFNIKSMSEKFEKLCK